MVVVLELLFGLDLVINALESLGTGMASEIYSYIRLGSQKIYSALFRLQIYSHRCYGGAPCYPAQAT